MSNHTSLPSREHMPSWAFQMMRLSMKAHDLFSPPQAKLGLFGIRPGWTVVDYGCGPGRYIKRAAELIGDSGRLYAVDIHDAAIDCVRRLKEKNKLTQVKVVQARDYFAPIQENSADLIMALDIFHMISDPDRFLNELHRIIKPSGKLILEDGHQSRKITLNKVESNLRWSVYREQKGYLECLPKWK